MEGLAILAGVFVLYALAASRLDRLWITAPMVFVVAGVVLGPTGAGALPSLENSTTLLITELTLALLLFADASTVRLREVRQDAVLPGRLLAIGLPLTMLAGAIAARLLYTDVAWAEAALIAAILAPTDVALGLAVVTNRVVPARIRRALNVESGLNDGIVTPFVTLFLAVALATEEGAGEGSWGVEALTQIGLAIGTAVVIGALGGKLLARARARGWTTPLSDQLAVLGMAVLAYQGAVAIGGNGFVAAFVGGLLFGAATRRSLGEAVEFTDSIGLFMSFFVWTVFGAVFVGQVIEAGGPGRAIAYAVASLTLVRMLPVAVALIGSRLRPDARIFMGWFGPRGLASVVFTLVAAEELTAHGVAPDALVDVATWTILLSVMAHGLTAHPLSSALGRRLTGAGPIPEVEAAADVAVRRRSLSERPDEGA